MDMWKPKKNFPTVKCINIQKIVIKIKKIHLFHRSYKHVDNFVNKEVYNKEKYGYN